VSNHPACIESGVGRPDDDADRCSLLTAGSPEGLRYA